MIPKIIHYVWFGGKPLPELAKKCIASWQKYCPDYQIKKWDETNFDIAHSCDYVREAYQAKRWAFVSDYVRLYALVNEGGIYMDTDVEVLKPLDRFLDEKAFSGFEDATHIPTGIMAAEKGFPLFRALLEDYSSRHFLLPDGTVDLNTNVVAITDSCLKRGLIPNNTKQTIDGFTLYPNDWFCPKSFVTQKISITANSYTIHHFNGSWKTKKEKRRFYRTIRLQSAFGVKKGNVLEQMIEFPDFVVQKIKQKGLIHVLSSPFRRKRKKEESAEEK